MVIRISFINRSTVAILTSGKIPMFQFPLSSPCSLRRPKMRRKRWPPREKSLSAEAIPIFLGGNQTNANVCMYLCIYLCIHVCHRMSVCLFACFFVCFAVIGCWLFNQPLPNLGSILLGLKPPRVTRRWWTRRLRLGVSEKYPGWFGLYRGFKSYPVI